MNYLIPLIAAFIVMSEGVRADDPPEISDARRMQRLLHGTDDRLEAFGGIPPREPAPLLLNRFPLAEVQRHQIRPFVGPQINPTLLHNRRLLSFFSVINGDPDWFRGNREEQIARLRQRLTDMQKKGSDIEKSIARGIGKELAARLQRDRDYNEARLVSELQVLQAFESAVKNALSKANPKVGDQAIAARARDVRSACINGTGNSDLATLSALRSWEHPPLARSGNSLANLNADQIRILPQDQQAEVLAVLQDDRFLAQDIHLFSSSLVIQIPRVVPRLESPFNP